MVVCFLGVSLLQVRVLAIAIEDAVVAVHNVMIKEFHLIPYRYQLGIHGRIPPLLYKFMSHTVNVFKIGKFI
ncbi:hypothetical protein D3C85_1629660 [compost metagenome]